MPDDEEPKEYTSAESWPTGDGGQDLELPSGAKVRVAPPAILWRGMTGGLPARLIAISAHHKADKKPWDQGETNLAIDWLIAESFVTPRCVMAKRAPAGCVSIHQISEADKEAICMRLRIQDYASALK